MSNLVRNALKFGDELDVPAVVDLTSDTGEFDCKCKSGGELGAVGLRGSYRDFGTGQRVEYVIGFAGYGTAYYIDDCECLCSERTGLPQCSQAVGSLSLL